MTNGQQQNHERRRFHRILFDAPTSVQDETGSYAVPLIDISLNGALIARPADWSGAMGDKVKLDVRLDEGETHIEMEAVVAHVEPEKIGLHCEHIDIDSISHLRRLAELNLGNPELVERELDALG